MNIFTSLGVDFSITDSDLKSKDGGKLTQELYALAFDFYQKKNTQLLYPSIG
jgi:preprotein translocase subunit SecA